MKDNDKLVHLAQEQARKDAKPKLQPLSGRVVADVAEAIAESTQNAQQEETEKALKNHPIEKDWDD